MKLLANYMDNLKNAQDLKKPRFRLKRCQIASAKQNLFIANSYSYNLPFLPKFSARKLWILI